jgi:hypothetical protein
LSAAVSRAMIIFFALKGMLNVSFHPTLRAGFLVSPLLVSDSFY